MNIFLWTLQILLALHTAIGAVWKLSNSEQVMPTLSAIPHTAWLAMSGIEVVCSIALIIPAVSKRLGILVPVAAAWIASEMLLFCGLHFYSGDANLGPVVYWLVVTAVCAFIAYGRSILKPF